MATLLFGQYAISIGRRTESPTLIAEGRHRQVDVLSSIVVLVSVILSYFDLHLNILGVTIDQIGAALILIFIACAGWELLSDGIRVAEWLVELGVEHVGMKEDISHKGPGYVLSNGGVKIHIVTKDHIDQAIDEIISEGP